MHGGEAAAQSESSLRVALLLTWPGLQACAKRRAILSVEANPHCPDKQAAERAVDEVWESCMQDTRPFDEIY